MNRSESSRTSSRAVSAWFQSTFPSRAKATALVNSMVLPEK